MPGVALKVCRRCQVAGWIGVLELVVPGVALKDWMIHPVIKRLIVDELVLPGVALKVEPVATLPQVEKGVLELVLPGVALEERGIERSATIVAISENAARPLFAVKKESITTGDRGYYRGITRSGERLGFRFRLAVEF